MMRNKYIVPISIGFVALVLTFLMITQFKTVQETDITAIETMRETELRTELATWKSKYDEIETQIDETTAKINEYKEQLSNNRNASAILDNEVREAETYLGYTNVQGEGIIVTLSDGEVFNIEYNDILRLVNELFGAGAEAISINDQRIVTITDITVVQNKFILVNGVKLTGPYVVKAIGDRKYLESAITIKGGYIDELLASYKNVAYTLEENIMILGYNNEIDFKYAENHVVEED